MPARQVPHNPAPLSAHRRQGVILSPRNYECCCLPQEKAAEIAFSAVKDFMQTKTSIKKVIFNVFKDSDREIYRSVLAAN